MAEFDELRRKLDAVTAKTSGQLDRLAEITARARDLADEHEQQGVYACEGLRGGEGCIDGRIYGSCGDPCCEGVCTDVYGPCPCRCHRGDADA